MTVENVAGVFALPVSSFSVHQRLEREKERGGYGYFYFYFFALLFFIPYVLESSLRNPTIGVFSLLYSVPSDDLIFVLWFVSFFAL